jgi:hypothetical protein
MREAQEMYYRRIDFACVENSNGAMQQVAYSGSPEVEAADSI